MNPAEELEQIESELAELGKQARQKEARALEILRGRVAVIRGNRFRIERAALHFGGSPQNPLKLYFGGPRLRPNGEPHARNSESVPLALIDEIEPRS